GPSRPDRGGCPPGADRGAASHRRTDGRRRRHRVPGLPSREPHHRRDPPDRRRLDSALGGGFTTVYGRNRLAEVPNFVTRPYLVVTMEDLWPLFAATLDGPDLAGVHEVTTLDAVELAAQPERLPGPRAGRGGG